MDAYEGFLARYESGELPWDDTLPPPEVLAMAETLPPGRALDVGCGYGRTAIYLSKKGWEAVGVDYVPQAIEIARQRAAEQDASPTFYNESVIDMPFLTGPFDLAVDIGCMHAFSDEERARYVSELGRLLGPKAVYMLYVHLKDEDAENPPGRNRPTPEGLRSLLAPYFALKRLEFGQTEVEDKDVWSSGWFWFERLED